jgi:hypothetical protein
MSAATTGADRSIAALRDALTGPMRGVSAATTQALGAQEVFQEASDIVEVMGALAGLIVCLESTIGAVEAAVLAARTVLARQMAETGATTLRTSAHTISLRDTPRAVMVMDPAAIPPEFMRQPPPKLDVAEIGKRLRAGELVPGVVLGNGGAPTLQIRNRERKAA